MKHMLFQWNEQTFTWFEDASDYTGYNRELAKLLLPCLKDCRNILDLGCGMGLVDFELAEDFNEVICSDISAEAIEYIQKKIRKTGITNLFAFCADGTDQERLKAQIAAVRKTGTSELPLVDGVLALFHGTVQTIGEMYLSYARKKLILVVHGSAIGSTGPEKYRVRKCTDVESTQEWLDSHGLHYDLLVTELEFGQPHRSIEEAIAYTGTFTRKAPENEITEYAKAHVIETGRTDFPYYTPKKRRFGLFSIDAG